MGQLYKAREKNEAAIALYRRAIEISSDFPEAYINLAALYQSEGDMQEVEVWRDFLREFGEEQTYSMHAR